MQTTTASITQALAAKFRRDSCTVVVDQTGEKVDAEVAALLDYLDRSMGKRCTSLHPAFSGRSGGRVDNNLWLDMSLSGDKMCEGQRDVAPGIL